MAADPGPQLEIGRITRPHGLRGEVLVALVTTETSRLDAGSTVQTASMGLTVERSSPHGRQWIVAFAGVLTREAAEELAGQVLTAAPKREADHADADADDPGDEAPLWVHELVGALVVDAAGVARGPVVAVVANPASDLLELESGALVPLRFVLGGVETGPDGRVVRVDPPDGLFDLD
jgi:16S rRNA processing protein RimM